MKLKEVMTSMDYEKLYKAYYLQVYSYTISLAKNREIGRTPQWRPFDHMTHKQNAVLRFAACHFGTLLTFTAPGE